MRNPNLGIRAGTELYYHYRPGSQLFQRVNAGYYYHRSLHHGFYLSSELGYRKFIGPVFLDASFGGGYLLLTSRVPLYRPAENVEFRKASSRLHKFMPTLGIGAGYWFTQASSLFVRYELFGEMPLGQDIIGIDSYWYYFPEYQATIIMFINKGTVTDKSVVDRVLF